MVNGLVTYLDFAENDFEFFMNAYGHNTVANQMGAIAQGICEKYMKHIIEEYVNPDNKEGVLEKENILRTHSLERLLKYLKRNVPELEMDRSKLKIIDGYYFSTRYPGNESIRIDEDDIEYCKNAIEECRDKVLKYARDNKVKEKQPDDFSMLPKKPDKKGKSR